LKNDRTIEDDQVRRRNNTLPVQGTKQTLGRKPDGDITGGLMTTVGYVSMRCESAVGFTSLNIGSCSAIVRHTRLSVCSMSFAATRRPAAYTRASQANRGQITAPPFLT
jgi:hypothetical protein